MSSINHNPVQFPLTKLVYALSGIVLVSGIYVTLLLELLRASFRTPGTWFHVSPGVLVVNANAAMLLLFLLTMLALIWWYRSSGAVFAWNFGKGTSRAIGIGVFAGLILSLLGCALSYRSPDLSLQVLLLSWGISIKGIPQLLALFVVLPIAGEMVFSGIVFGTLSEHVSIPAAAIGSTLAFAFIWPLFDVATRLLLGLTSAILFYRTRSLVAPIAANVVVTSCICIFIILRSLRVL
jgi:membrane protease YdiL (CAAX protease family)